MTEKTEPETWLAKYSVEVFTTLLILGGIISFIIFVNYYTSSNPATTAMDISASSSPQALVPTPLSQQAATNDTGTQILSLQRRLDDLELQLKSQEQQNRNQGTLPQINARAIVFIFCINGDQVQTGSGTIVTADGYIITNKHVIASDNGVPLCGALMQEDNSTGLDPSSYYRLSIFVPGAGYYGDLDVAKLKITGRFDRTTDQTFALPESFPFITPADSLPNMGDPLFIFGYPAASDLAFNVTTGIVSSISNDKSYFNTNAIINHGNSGGAAFASDGQFVGIPTSKYVANNDYLGRVIPFSSFYYVH